MGLARVLESLATDVLATVAISGELIFAGSAEEEEVAIIHDSIEIDVYSPEITLRVREVDVRGRNRETETENDYDWRRLPKN